MWLPPGVARAFNEAQSDEALMMQMVMIDEAVRHYTAELKTIDPDLELVKANNHTQLQGLVPGYWHIIRKGTPVNIITLQGENGEFREPGSWMYEWLQKQDLWNDRAQRERTELAEKARSAKERELELERQDRIDEFNERVASLGRTSVSFSPTKKIWTAGPAVPQPKKG